MKQDLNKYLKERNENEIIEKQDFKISSRVDINKHSFKDCSFEIIDSCELYISHTTLTNCKIHGLSDLESDLSNIVTIDNSILNNLDLIYKFQRISISHSELNNLIDISFCETFILADSKVFDFFIRGECSFLNISNSYFGFIKRNDSVWNKSILKHAVCKKTIFHKVQVNPFYFSVKCDDKSSLDMSSSSLIDDWSRLRKKYSGVSLFIVFLLTFLFFLPLITHSFMLLLYAKLNFLTKEVEMVPLWQSILYGGKSGWTAFGYSILTIILFSYNIIRIYLTISIARLREEEKFLSDSNFQLVSIHPEKYKVQLWYDKILNILIYVSVIYAIFKILDTLTILVPSLK